MYLYSDQAEYVDEPLEYVDEPHDDDNSDNCPSEESYHSQLNSDDENELQNYEGKFNGVLVAATGIDGNNSIFPVAYGILESENTNSWTWFLDVGFIDKIIIVVC